MIERDYLMRMVSLMTAALARILRLKHEHEFPEALSEINTTGRTLLGVDRALMQLLSDEQLLELLGKDVTLEIPKCYVLGVLLREEAEIIQLQGSADESPLVSLKALNLLAETYLRHSGPVEPDHGQNISFLINQLSDVQLPMKTLVRLFRYFTMCGTYDRAEDTLFRIIESDISFYDEGFLFYQRLLGMSDEDLSKGNLPRDEVSEGLAELRKRQEASHQPE